MHTYIHETVKWDQRESLIAMRDMFPPMNCLDDLHAWGGEGIEVRFCNFSRNRIQTHVCYVNS